MEKRVSFIILLSMFFLSLSLVSAGGLDVEAKTVSNSVIVDLNEPAVFDLILKNSGVTDTFEIYSLIGMDITPKESFTLKSSETRSIQIKVMPQDALKSKLGFLTFAYIIKGKNTGIKEDTLTVNILKLENTFSVIPANINPKSDKIIISFKNTAQKDFPDLKISMSSAFFDYKADLPIKSLETKELEIPLDKERVRTLNSGQYLLNTEVDTSGKSADVESLINFLEQEDIETNEINEGFMIKRYEVSKKNVGNIKKSVEIFAEKDLFSYLFTTVNVAPTQTEVKGLKKYYIWEKELIPNEELKVVVKTNWLYPIFVVILAIVLFIFIKRSVEKDVIVRKQVSFVKTTGGQFALKVTLKLKSKRFIEKINVMDKLPPLVKLYEKFGSIIPDKIDTNNRRLEWNIESLNEDEERIFTYIIYSKIGVVGRFELPSAKVTYEKDAMMKTTFSNRSFFINEPKKMK